MNSKLSAWSVLAIVPIISGLLGGCADVRYPAGIPATEMRPDDHGFVSGTGVESQDLIRVADKMTRGLLSIPQVTNAQGSPCVVLIPVINETRFPINKDIFLTRIRTELNSQASGKITFLARDNMPQLERERQLKQAGQITSSSDPTLVEFKGADFFLTGKLQGITTRTSQGTSDYILYAFQLVDARTSAVVWDGFDEIKKQGLEDAAYR